MAGPGDCLLRALALSDVLHHADGELGVSPNAPDQGHGQVDPNQPAIFADVTLLSLVVVPFSFEQLSVEAPIRRPILRMSEGGEHLSAQLFFAITEHRAHRRIVLDKPSLHIDEPYANRGRLKDRPQSRLTLSQRFFCAFARADVDQ